MTRSWLAVASADHVALGRHGGFMQVAHGKLAPLRRIRPGDRVVYYSPNRYYSPSHLRRDQDRLQAFTAIGTVLEGEPYRVDMELGFQPYRRDVAWHGARQIPIAELAGELAFLQARNWGYRLRQGLVEVDAADMTTIAGAMLTGAVRPYRQAA